VTDPLAEIRRWADLVTAAEMEREESRRTYVVPDRDLAVQIEALAAALGVDDLVTVVTNPMMPAGQAYVINAQAMRAAGAEALQHMLRRPLFGGWWP
jgi:hypothetical protein